MSDQQRDDARAQDEAAAWFTRFGRRAVTTQSLREFRAWRSAPANAAAYARLESAWSKAGRLAAAPEIRAATEAALSRRSLRGRLSDLKPSRRVALGLAGAAVAVAAGVYVAPLALQPAYATGLGEQRLVVLDDGSRVRLNTDSRIRVRFSSGQRRIALARGQAFFDVAPDPARPFLVDAGAADIRALGTRFDVRRDNGTVHVTLLEGSVRVRQDDSSNAWTLAPNQQLTLAPGHAPAKRAADAARATSWTEGRLVFHETPLAAAVAEVNRYARTRIELADPALARAPVNGVFDTGDTEAFVAAVSMLFDLKAVRASDGTIRLQDGAA